MADGVDDQLGIVERDMMPALRVDDDLAVSRQLRKSQLLFPLLCRETFPVIRRDTGWSVRLLSTLVGFVTE
jgi:hypothetical protein